MLTFFMKTITYFLITLVLTLSANMYYGDALKYKQPTIAEIIEYEAGQYSNVTPNLVDAIIRVESQYVETAISDKDCKGLMQISQACMDHYNKVFKTEYTQADIFKPKVNVKIGAWYISYCIDLKNSLPKGLTAYNWGPWHTNTKPGYSRLVLSKIRSEMR